MKLRRGLDYGLLICAVGLTRLVCRSHRLYDIDSVNFALALDRFDPEAHQPHPPGYFLYVGLGRLARAIFQDANTALVAVSIVASCAAAAMIYALAESWFGRKAAIWGGLIFLFSPLCWFHGTVALTYVVECFFSALVGYLCWQTYCGRFAFLAPSAVALGLAAGFRQSTILFLGPLWLLSLCKAPRRHVLISFTALTLTTLAWCVPMALQSRGWAVYAASLYGLWSLVPAKETVLTSPIALSLARFCTILGIFGLTFGGASLWGLPSRETHSLEKTKKTFLWVWIAPGLLFFTLVYLKFVNSGYLLVLSPPIFAWLGSRAAAWFARAKIGAWRKAAAAGALAAMNAAIYLYGPFYCSRRAVRTFETELATIQKGLRQVVGAEEALIVGFDSHFLGYRHAGYYLPEYLTVLFPEVPSPTGKRVFSLRGRDTQLLNRIPLDSFSTFVLFPLPSGSPYREHMALFTGRLPKDAWRMKVAEGQQFFIGSTTDLTLLFPSSDPHRALASTAGNNIR